MKRRLSSFILCTILIMITCVSCAEIKSGDFNFTNGNGEMKEAIYSFSKYTKVVIDGGAEVIYSSENSDNIKVYMNENHLKVFDASVNGDTLRLKWNKTVIYTLNNTPKIYISNSNLEEMTIHGAAKIKDADVIKGDSFELSVSGACDLDLSFDVNNLKVNISGAGRMNLSGNAKTADMIIAGAGDINGFDLKVNSADIKIYGTGSAEIYCMDKLDGLIAGAGSIRYKGDPSVSPTIMGAGSVKRAD